MKFWDTSGILPLIVQEKESAALRAILAADRDVIVWWGCAVEVCSALARLEREGALADNDRAYEILEKHEATWNEVVPSPFVRRTARRLLRVHSLRAADALQLAAAIVASGDDPSSLAFVCRDERLSAAARKEGFEIC